MFIIKCKLLLLQKSKVIHNHWTSNHFSEQKKYWIDAINIWVKVQTCEIGVNSKCCVHLCLPQTYHHSQVMFARWNIISITPNHWRISNIPKIRLSASFTGNCRLKKRSLLTSLAWHDNYNFLNAQYNIHPQSLPTK